jgi:hypothetical protein
MVTEGAARKDRLIEKLASGRETFLSAVALLDETALTRQVWTDGGHWSARELIAHVAYAEEGMLGLINATLADNPPHPNPEFDIDRFNEGRIRRAADATVQALLERLAQTREETLNLLAQIAESDLDRPSYHPVVKETTVEGIFRVIGFHERMHAKELRALHERAAAG